MISKNYQTSSKRKKEEMTAIYLFKKFDD
eukprot:UN01964